MIELHRMKIILLVILLLFSICYPSAGSSSSGKTFSSAIPSLLITSLFLATLRKNPIVKSKPKYLHFDLTLDINGVASEGLSDDSQRAIAEAISDITSIPQGNIQFQEEIHREKRKNGHWSVKAKLLVGTNIDSFPQFHQNGQKLYFYLKTLLKESIKESGNDPAIFTNLVQKNSILWGRELFYAKVAKIDISNPRLSVDTNGLPASPTSRPSSQPTSSPTRVQTAPSYNNFNYPTSQPSAQPTSSPTHAQTAPTYYNFKQPTNQPTSAPTNAPDLDVLQFDVYWDVLNVSTSALSTIAVDAYRTTIADVLDLPIGQVHFIGVKSIPVSPSCFELEVQTRLTVPLSEFPEYNYNATKLYIYLTTIMLNSVAGSSFTKLLRKESWKVDAMETFWADVVHVQFFPFALIASTAEPTVNPTAAPTIAPSFAPSVTQSLAPTFPVPGGTSPPTTGGGGGGGGSGWATGSPTRSPTFKPTQQTKDILIYQATFTLKNSSASVLVDKDYTAFFNTIATGLKTQVSNIKLLNNSHIITKTTLTSINLLQSSYDVIVNVDLTLPLIDYPEFNNATDLYQSSSKNLTNSIFDGSLTTSLRSFAGIYQSDNLAFAYFTQVETGHIRIVSASFIDTAGQNSPSTKEAISMIIIASVISGGIIFLGCILLAIYVLYTRYQRYQLEKKGISSVRIPIEKTISHDMPFDDIYSWERPQQNDLIVIDVDDESIASFNERIPHGMQSDDDGDEPYSHYPVTVPSRNSMNFSSFELDFEYALSPRQSLNLRNQILELNFVPGNHTAESRM